MFGLRLAAIYGFPPSRLGFCGPGGDKNLRILVDFIAGGDSLTKEARQILGRFEAAYGYYRLIARANGVADPFDQRVVEAYWLGNSLLDTVGLDDLKRLILNDFCKPGLLTPKQAEEKVAAIPLGTKPHHSFHVLILGSITGRVKFTDKIRDVCRIGWGKIIKVGSKKLEVRSKSLRSRKGKFYLAKPAERTIDWGPVFVPRVKVADVVSFHWNRACQVLSRRQQKNLEKYTQINIDAFNGRRR